MIGKKRITFESFLSGIPARDYIFQKTPYEEQIRQAAKKIQEADYVLMGAGAGMSAAAGQFTAANGSRRILPISVQSMVTDHICRTCTAQAFIPIPQRKPTGATGQSKPCLQALKPIIHRCIKHCCQCWTTRKSSAFPPMRTVSLRRQVCP